MDSEHLYNPQNVFPMNNFVVLLMKKCNTFLSHADVQLGIKFYDLNVLCSIWKADTNEGKLILLTTCKLMLKMILRKFLYERIFCYALI